MYLSPFDFLSQFQNDSAGGKKCTYYSLQLKFRKTRLILKLLHHDHPTDILFEWSNNTLMHYLLNNLRFHIRNWNYALFCFMIISDLCIKPFYKQSRVRVDSKMDNLVMILVIILIKTHSKQTFKRDISLNEQRKNHKIILLLFVFLFIVVWVFVYCILFIFYHLFSFLKCETCQWSHAESWHMPNNSYLYILHFLDK